MDTDNAQQWTAIGQTSNQLILYHPSSHALSVQPHTSLSIAGPSRPTQPLLLPYTPPTPDVEASIGSICPTCSQPLPSDRAQPSPSSSAFRTPRGEMRTRGYFQILEDAHEMSRPPSPSMSMRFERTPTPAQEDDDLLDEMHLPAKGYYREYFREERKLGMGAEGSVFLATHVISGNVLGTYAVKKIAVGRSKAYLVKMLREVKLLEALRHPNIIPYHHSWVDVTTFSSFGEPITALHVLMMYATAGNLDTYLITRAHSPNPDASDLTAGGLADGDSLGQLPRAERIKAFKQRRQSSVGGTGARKKREETRGVLLLGVEEIGKLFGDVVEGLAFLHANSILHLDLKCSNVLLHWEDGKLIPKALLSDFGTSEEMLKGKRERTGHTGTMAYMAPETLVTDLDGNWRPSDSHADMWSLGLILYKLLYLQLPFPDTEDYESLLQSIIAYPGFIPTAALYAACERRHIPRELLVLLSKLINVDPNFRPTAERVRTTLRGLVSHFWESQLVQELSYQESQARSASNPNTSPKAGLVAKVQKFSQGMVSYISSPPPEDSRNIVQPYRLPPGLSSPVQPVLALPSPPLETPRDFGQLPRTVADGPSTLHRWKLMESSIRFLIAAAKIIFLQVGATFNTRIKIFLMFLTLIEIKCDEWSITIPWAVIFVAMVIAHDILDESK